MTYNIFLDNKKIGTTLLEKADAPMGIVFGQINCEDKSISFDFLSKYCKDNHIETTEYAEDKLITTRTIPALKVISDNGTEIKGEGGANIEGMDNEGFEIFIYSIPYPFYEKQFPHHTKAYKEQFE